MTPEETLRVLLNEVRAACAPDSGLKSPWWDNLAGALEDYDNACADSPVAPLVSSESPPEPAGDEWEPCPGSGDEVPSEGSWVCDCCDVPTLAEAGYDRGDPDTEPTWALIDHSRKVEQ